MTIDWRIGGKPKTLSGVQPKIAEKRISPRLHHSSRTVNAASPDI
jgi:hypothetical protein